MILCAAIRVYGDTVICGARHYDKVMLSALAHLKDPYSSANVEHGFINHEGEFLNREDALIHATACGQIGRLKSHPLTKLFSEDLY